METTSRQINVTILRPATGRYITQKNLDNERNRVFSQELWLGVNDNADNWHEVSEAYKTQWEAEEQQRIKD